MTQLVLPGDRTPLAASTGSGLPGIQTFFSLYVGQGHFHSNLPSLLLSKSKSNLSFRRSSILSHIICSNKISAYLIPFQDLLPRGPRNLYINDRGQRTQAETGSGGSCAHYPLDEEDVWVGRWDKITPVTNDGSITKDHQAWPGKASNQ